MNKKQLIAAWVILFLLSGCASAAFHVTKQGMYEAMSARAVNYSRVYDYPKEDVYDAIVSVLTKRLNYGVSRLYSTKDMVFSSFCEAPSRGQIFNYAYLFNLKKIDDTHTEVSLKASGALWIVSDKDMLDRYVKEELEYLDRTEKE